MPQPLPDYHVQGDTREAHAHKADEQHAKEVEQLLAQASTVYNAGDFHQALTHTQQALSIAQAMEDRATVVVCFGNLALISRRLNDFQRSMEYTEHTLVLARALEDRLTEALCLNNLGKTYRNLGNFPKAMEYAEQALVITRMLGDRQQETACLSSLADVSWNLGDFPHAIAYTEQILAMAREAGDRHTEGRCLANLGLHHRHLGHLPQAATYYEQALTIAQAMGDRLTEGTLMGNLGVVSNQLRDFAKALTWTEQALTLSRSHGDRYREGLWLGNLGTTYRGLGDFQQAIAYHKKALEILQTIHTVDDERYFWIDLGYTYLQMEQAHEAYEAFRSALALFERLRGAVSQPQHRSTFLEVGLSAYQGMVRACLRLSRHGEAFEYVEQAKSDRLVALLAGHDLRPKAPGVAPLIPAYESLRDKLRGLDAVVRLWQETQPDHLMNQQARAEFADVKGQFDHHVAQIKGLDPDFVAQMQVETLRYPEMQSAIPDEVTALIAFFMTEEHTLAFIVRKSGAPLPPYVLTELSPTDAQQLTQTWLQHYTAYRQHPAAEWQRWRETMDATLSTLYERLFAPLQPLLAAHQIRKLLFVPHHVLHLFPLHALFTETQGHRRYLLDMYDEITYAPSVGVLRRCQARRRPVPQRLLLVCNPDERGQYGRPLTYAVHEAEGILAMYPTACVRKAEDGSAEEVVDAAQDCHILHLICHGFFDIHQPLQSYLGLSSGRYTLGEIFAQLDLPETSLVILSACETGMTEVRRTDEYIGLPSGFLSAGSPSVIASLWMVDDEATSLLMRKLYEHLQAGLQKAQALHEAQRWLRSLRHETPASATAHADPRFTLLSAPRPVDYTHPFYWAAFFLSGAP